LPSDVGSINVSLRVGVLEDATHGVVQIRVFAKGAVVAAGEVAGAVVVIPGGKQALVACVQALLGEQAVAVLAQLAVQAAGGQFLLGELAQRVAL
jgi:hypothetical protein